MAAFLKVSVGVTSLGCVWLLANRYKNENILLANSYGSDVFERKNTVKWDKNWDRRATQHTSGTSKENESTNIAKPTAKRHLILIRHGQYVHANKSEDKILTELGRRQALATGLRLKALGLPYTIVHYSTMVRATETAQIICECLPGVPTISTDILREGAPIEPIPPSRHWKPEHWEFFQDGVRIEAAFRQFFYRASPEQTQDSTEVIVCHGNVIRFFVCRALQLPPEAWLRISIANCGITRLTIRPNGMVSLQSLGDSGHLPSDMITFN